MAEICSGVVLAEGEKNNPGLSTACESASCRAARKRRMEIRSFKIVNGVSNLTATAAKDDESDIIDDGTKRERNVFASSSTSFPRECIPNACVVSEDRVRNTISSIDNTNAKSSEEKDEASTTSGFKSSIFNVQNFVPKFGVAAVCGRRRDMEDAVAIHPSFFQSEKLSDSDVSPDLHYFGVYDGHGCSHVATRCRERLHELAKEELVAVPEWKLAMERSFSRMDKEAIAWNEGVVGNCRCELQTPECDAVGSTAVVAIVTPDKIIVANCGDSRAVLCRNGKAFPLSEDHKPDRPDELNRIEEAGGRVIYWDGARVLGVLAMSRAIGDNYLKPYVSCVPEVTIMDRTVDDECLILASDGLWDVVSNDTACGVARMCLQGKVPPATLTPEVEKFTGVGEGAVPDKACSDASMLLTKLALARHSADNVSVVVIDLRKDA